MSVETAFETFGSQIKEDGHKLYAPDLPHEIVSEAFFSFRLHLYPLEDAYIVAILDRETHVLVDYEGADTRLDAHMELLRWLAESWHALTALHADEVETVIAFDPPEIESAAAYERAWQAIYKDRRRKQMEK